MGSAGLRAEVRRELERTAFQCQRAAEHLVQAGKDCSAGGRPDMEQTLQVFHEMILRVKAMVEEYRETV